MRLVEDGKGVPVKDGDGKRATTRYRNSADTDHAAFTPHHDRGATGLLPLQGEGRAPDLDENDAEIERAETLLEHHADIAQRAA